ncbi:hypothetical protein, partial [Stutzerimonas kunmingensis]
IFEFGEGLLHARNKAHGGGWLRGLSVPRVGAAGYLCSVSLKIMPVNTDLKKALLKSSKK